MLLYLCTPRCSSVSLQGSCWTQNLPWTGFCASHLDNFLACIDALPNPGVQQPTPFGHQISKAIARHDAPRDFSLLASQGLELLSAPQKLDLASAIFHILARNILSVVIGSEEMTAQLLTRKSVDCFAAQLDRIMPETYPGENLQRASVLASRNLSGIQAKLLEILLYLASNNLIFKVNSYDEDYVIKSQMIISLWRLSGLNQPHTMDFLIQLARSTSTLFVVIGTVFKAAVYAKALDITTYLLRAGTRISLNSRIFEISLLLPCFGWSGRVTPLEYAVSRGWIDFAKSLLESTADVHSEVSLTSSPCLTIAILALPLVKLRIW